MTRSSAQDGNRPLAAPATSDARPRHRHSGLRNPRATLLAMTCAFTVMTGSDSDGQPAPKSVPMVGVSLAGPEFGTGRAEFSNANPGKPGVDYNHGSQASVDYFAKQGLKLFRLPVRWERLQPQLSGELNQLELQRVSTFLRWVRENQGQVILDLHNYCRYRVGTAADGVVECIIDERINGRVPVSRGDFADFWRRIVVEFREHPTIYAFQLMNEPHDLGSSDWKAISQAAVDAIRAAGDKHLLLVDGNAWSNPERWNDENGSKAWVRDPLGRVAYTANCYFDHDSSGKYRLTYDEELARDPDLRKRGRERIAPFIDWCAQNRVSGVIGEFGTPRDVRWKQVLQPFLQSTRQARMTSVWWAAGDWWRDYPLSLQPSADFVTAAPQMAWILPLKSPPQTLSDNAAPP